MSGDGTPCTVERYFRHLTGRDWKRLGELLDADVERIGPFGDRAVGRELYLSFLEGVVPEEYGNEVLRIIYAPDGRSAFARVREHLKFADKEYHNEETYYFDITDQATISRVEVFWQTPSLDPGGLGSASGKDSYA
jgi:hypothetical protein